MVVEILGRALRGRSARHWRRVLGYRLTDLVKGPQHFGVVTEPGLVQKRLELRRRETADSFLRDLQVLVELRAAELFVRSRLLSPFLQPLFVRGLQLRRIRAHELLRAL